MNILESEKIQIINDYQKNKINITKLSKKYHHSVRTITKILDEYKINHRRGNLRKGISNIACKRVFSQEEKDIIFEIISQGGSIKDCMLALHCGQDSLRCVLQELGLYKTHAEAMKQLPQNQRKYSVKDDFFETQSSNMAYILGFLASDGTVRKDSNEIKLSVSTVDKEILEKMFALVGGRPIKDYITNQGFEVSTWVFTSKKIKDTLAEYSIVPQKTFVLQPPKKLYHHFWIDYIRGYFDGDGSVNIIHNGTALRWQICSATKEILQWIIDFLYEEYNIPKVQILSQQRAKHILYYFQYSTTATKQIYDILYTKDSLALKRKKEHFDEIIKIKFNKK